MHSEEGTTAQGEGGTAGATTVPTDTKGGDSINGGPQQGTTSPTRQGTAQGGVDAAEGARVRAQSVGSSSAAGL